MIVYVESNYVMELAYLQEAHGDCEKLLALAEAGRISMVLPAYCFIESRRTRSDRATRRTDLHRANEQEIRELSRSARYPDIREKSRELMMAILGSKEEDSKRLDETLDRLSVCSHVAPLFDKTVKLATDYEKRFSLKPPDAAILATILQHARSAGKEPKAFLNKNSKDFLNPDIVGELAACQCALYGNFNQGFYEITEALGGKRKGGS